MIVFLLLITAELTAISLHAIGIYLLHCLKVENKSDIEHFYVLNLSIFELLITICLFIKTILFLVPSSTGLQQFLPFLYIHIDMFMFVFLSFGIYMNMFYIVIDKTMQVFLNLKYHLYWNIKKARRLEIFTWIGGFGTTVGFCVSFHKFGFDFRKNFVVYFRPVNDVLFVITVIACYSYIFFKYKSTRDAPVTHVVSSTSRQTSTTTFTIFCNSRFFLSVCLVSTFIMFVIIPDVVLIFITIENDVNKSQVRNGIVTFVIIISYIVDAIIYILLNHKVQQIFYKKLRKLNCFAFRSVNTEQSLGSVEVQ